MIDILFATHNKHKVSEVNSLLKDKYNVITPEALGYNEEVAETGHTFEENAKIKVDAIKTIFKGSIFSEDTGLLVEALGGEPGVRTARFAGEDATANDNMDKLLQELKGLKNRKAYFKTVICLWHKDNYHYFTGECHGNISSSKSGKNGFGYDPIFVPLGYELSFAELGEEVKKSESHRAKAVKALTQFLNEN